MRRHGRGRLTRCTAVAVWLAAAGGAADAGGAAEPALPAVLVSAEWLQPNLGRVTVLDARAPAAYARGHVPGAASVPAGSLGGPVPGRLAPLPRLKALLEGAGVRAGRPVVVYDDGRLKDAARLFWVLEVLGHPAVAVLKGGWPAWRGRSGAGGEAAAAAGRGAFVPTVRTDRLATRLDVRLALDDPGVVIVDAREAAAYAGIVPSGLRPGRIPGAINVPYLAHFDGRGAFVEQERLRALYAPVLGRSRARRVIVYCEQGREAAVAYLALRLLGLAPALYHGGWRDWTTDPALPVADGPAPGAAAMAGGGA